MCLCFLELFKICLNLKLKKRIQLKNYKILFFFRHFYVKHLENAKKVQVLKYKCMYC